MHGGIAVAVAATALLQDVGRLGHRFHPAGYAQFGLTDRNLTMGERNGVEARWAGLVDRRRRHSERNAALERGLSGGHLSGAALHDLTHVGEVDVLARHTGSFQRLFDREAAEVGAAERCERARHLADRGASAGENHGFRHGRKRIAPGDRGRMSGRRWRFREGRRSPCRGGWQPRVLGVRRRRRRRVAGIRWRRRCRQGVAGERCSVLPRHKSR